MWLAVLARMRRRRNSFRQLLFFGCQGCLGVAAFIGSILIYVIIYGNYHLVHLECAVDDKTLVTSNSGLMNLTLRNRESVVCKDATGDREIVGGACDLADMEALFNVIMASGVCVVCQALVSFLLAFAYRMFTNLPTELLQHGKVGFMSRCFGGICKILPWWNRFFQLVQFVILGVLWYTVLFYYCKGQFAKVWNCRNFFSNCAYNKLKNCRYYYRHCVANDALLTKCWVSEERKAFSGRMDIRLLTHDNCTRCQILAADFGKATDSDTYFLLEEADKGTENWKCKTNAQSCFSTSSMSAIACECTKTANDIFSTEAMTALTGTCTTSRRLQDYEPAFPRPCWLGNVTACPSIAREEKRVLASFQAAAAAARQSLQRALPEPSRRPVLTRQSLKKGMSGDLQQSDRRLQNETNATNGTGNATASTAAPEVVSTAAPTQTVTPQAVQGAPITAQQCDWGPTTPEDYWFGAEDCTMQGSYLYRTALLYLYLGIVIWIGICFVGQMVRITSKPEPWFFQPAAPNENRFWRCCRKIAP